MPTRLQNCSKKVQARLPTSQPGTLGKARNNIKTKMSTHAVVPASGSSNRIPPRFQDCSGFSGCAFSCHHSPAPVIETQQIRCWEFCCLSVLHCSISVYLCQCGLAVYDQNSPRIHPKGHSARSVSFLSILQLDCFKSVPELGLDR